MILNIEKRTRGSISDPWGVWATTNDPAPFVNTDTVQYRQSNDVSITDFTSNVVTNPDVEDPSIYVVTGDGIFDKMMESFNKHIQAQYDSGRIVGEQYANVYLGGTQFIITEAANFTRQEKLLEADLALKYAQLINEEKSGELLTEQVKREKATIQSIRAETYDKTELEIDQTLSNYAYVEGLNTSHNKANKRADQDLLNSKNQEKVIASQADKLLQEIALLTAQLAIEFNRDVQYLYKVTNNQDSVVEYTYTPDTFVDGTPLGYVYTKSLATLAEADAQGLSRVNVVDTSDPNFDITAVPNTRLDIDKLKARVEADIAINTAKGYIADTYYKAGREIRETMFAFANAGVITQEDETGTPSNLYRGLKGSLEIALNRQAKVWEPNYNPNGTNIPYVDLNNNGQFEV